MEGSDRESGLESMLPPVRRWFRETFGHETEPQRLGWQSIQAGKHTLILAPTGSGKTLAAFLACLDHVWRELPDIPGVRVLYISPLKALNYDIERNLEGPIDGILQTADSLMTPLRSLRIGVRTGDTAPADRRRQRDHPPEVLVTTPESLHLLLTSRSRAIFEGLSFVIVDEIHALCSNKRGVFLALLLERLEEVAQDSLLRIGLSATQRPLEVVARYLGGWEQDPGFKEQSGLLKYRPRPVSIVDCGTARSMELSLTLPPLTPISQESSSVWPGIEADLDDLIRNHRSTIVFSNDRRQAERLASRLSERFESSVDDAESEKTAGLQVRAHHGSVSLERRRETEDQLKRGELHAVIATASLEMGVDMGTVDLVCQIGSPGSVSRGLQRVGRAGHAVGGTSRGKLFARTPLELLELAALCDGMNDGAVEPSEIPQNCLDLLAQQVVAAVAVEPQDPIRLFEVVRRAEPYHSLSIEEFEYVLMMVSGRLLNVDVRDLQPRIRWDRLENRLVPLPGSHRHAIINGGAIPETGQFPVFFGVGGPRLGELDEEFVLERRVGETFQLGSSNWSIEAIESDRMIVSRAEGRPSIMPFWRGERSGRSAGLGSRVGALLRFLEQGSLSTLDKETEPTIDPRPQTLQLLDDRSLQTLRDLVRRQRLKAGVVPTDRRVVVEAVPDPTGDHQLAILSPLGARFHLTLKLATLGLLRERFGIQAASYHGDDGILFRIPRTEEPPVNLLSELLDNDPHRLIVEELGESPLFGLRFRQNAQRALLMPRVDPNKRTPLWLQRLRAKDLLQIVRQHPDFPIVIETYRECLNDDLDLPGLHRFLGQIREGVIDVAERIGVEPSPFTSALQNSFTNTYLYEWDEPKRAGKNGPATTDLSEDRRASLLEFDPETTALDPQAVERVDLRLRGIDRPPRSLDEAAELLRNSGDLCSSEITEQIGTFLGELERSGNVTRFRFRSDEFRERWILTEDLPLYHSAFPDQDEAIGISTASKALTTIIRRYCRTRVFVGTADLIKRYGLEPELARKLLIDLAGDGALVDARERGVTEERWSDPRSLEEVRRLTIAQRRREVIAVRPEVFADYLLYHQGLANSGSTSIGSDGLASILGILRGFAAPLVVWEQDLLPCRSPKFRNQELDELLRSSEWSWCSLDEDVGLIPDWFEGILPDRHETIANGTSEKFEHARAVQRVLEELGTLDRVKLVERTGLRPSVVNQALELLVRAGLLTSERLGPIRDGFSRDHQSSKSEGSGRQQQSRGLSRHRRVGRRQSDDGEVRWSLIPGRPQRDPEESTMAWAGALLDRYGILCREIVNREPWSPTWGELFPILDRAELRGELRRGFFVEGLSGIQFATPDTAEELQRHDRRCHPDSSLETPITLLATGDPANLYGTGGPFDIPLLEGGSARLPRSRGTYLILKGGRPLLVAEHWGKRLSTIPSAGHQELISATRLLPRLLRGDRKTVKIEQIDGQSPLSHPLAGALKEAGFVRIPPALIYYKSWN